MTTIGRTELYERVWQTPMVKLAKEFGLSDQGLAKICKRHGIPLPPRGHWVKKETGKPVVQTPLPALDAGMSEQITIYGMSDAQAAAMAVKEQSRSAREEITGIVVPEDLKGLHHIVAGWIDEHKRDQGRGFHPSCAAW